MEKFNNFVDSYLKETPFKDIVANQLSELFSSDLEFISFNEKLWVFLFKKGEKYAIFLEKELTSLYWIKEQDFNKRFNLENIPSNIIRLWDTIVFEVEENGFIVQKSLA